MKCLPIYSLSQYSLFLTLNWLKYHEGTFQALYNNLSILYQSSLITYIVQFELMILSECILYADMYMILKDPFYPKERR